MMCFLGLMVAKACQGETSTDAWVVQKKQREWLRPPNVDSLLWPYCNFTYIMRDLISSADFIVLGPAFWL